MIDTSLWNNSYRMRIRIKNLATMILTLGIINLYLAITTKSWFLVGINILYAITTIPLFLSHAKWQKQPPKKNDN